MSIYISRSNMPSLSEYTKYLKKIWKDRWLTNHGDYVQELEKKLEKYWGVKNVVCVSNGTTALMLTLKAMGIKEINTTPNSFIATCSAPAWMGIKLNFVDKNEKINGPALITHTFGLPNIIKAKPVIYDASHAFDVKVNGKSIMTYGDASIISFHAVKIFHTIEGGAVVTKDKKLADKIRWMRNFGFKTRYSFHGAGINGKMTEFEAAMGLCNLPKIDKIRAKYNKIIDLYNEELGLELEQVTYYPIWYQTEHKLLKAVKEFEKNDIFVRRYFYPPLNKVFGGKSCPITEDQMKRTLCLPLYYDLSLKDAYKVAQIAKKTLWE